MYSFYPYFTNDGSVGLYSPDDNDIYHSTYGALSEAYEKFIFPADIEKFLKENSEIKILDICYGIGYNTKSFLNCVLDFLYNETIDTDNNKCINKIYTNNIIRKIYIHAIDNDKYLTYLSPFFVCNKNNIKNNKLDFYEERVSRMLSGKTVSKYNLRKEVNIILLKKLYKSIDKEIQSLLRERKYSKYFDRDLKTLYTHYHLNHECNTPFKKLLAILHNIYYLHLSKRDKMADKVLKLLNFEFNLEITDARKGLKADTIKYNFIFLDAFTPVKCPCLWTVDFFKLLYEHLEEDGMILTYSNSALVRNAFINAGFHVGKIYSESLNKFTGTIAVKNKSLIKYELSEYDLGLMKTKAGIFYQDENLNLSNEAIIDAHTREVQNSDLQTSSRFIKQFKENNEI